MCDDRSSTASTGSGNADPSMRGLLDEQQRIEVALLVRLGNINVHRLPVRQTFALSIFALNVQCVATIRCNQRCDDLLPMPS